MNDIEVSLVLPAYNEVDRLERAVTIALTKLQEITPSFEILIAEDGSSDGTDMVANKLASLNSVIRHLHSDERLGRGKALNRAFKESRGSILIYMDIDLATDVNKLRPLVDAIRGGADLATGSRTLPGSRVSRSTYRRVASWGYNTLIRVLLRSPVHDHQCGFKAFKKASLFRYINEVEDTHWFWDTEVIVRGVRHGFKVSEIPVDWSEGEETKVKFLRDSWRMASNAFHLWWIMRDG